MNPGLSRSAVVFCFAALLLFSLSCGDSPAPADSPGTNEGGGAKEIREQVFLTIEGMT